MLRDIATAATLIGVGWLAYRLEKLMANATEQLTEFRAAFTDFVSDVDAKLTQLADAQGNLNPEAQQIMDDLKATLAAKDAEIGDADGSDTPTEPVEPANPNV